ncbi:hypothetical protein D3C81_1717450 [compost metagenome]
MAEAAPGFRFDTSTQTRACCSAGAHFSMWKASGVRSSPATKRRSEPSALTSAKSKLPVCRRIRTGARATSPVTPAAWAFRLILVR